MVYTPRMQNARYIHYGDPRGMTYGVQMLLVANIAVAIIDWLIFPLSRYFALTGDWWTHFGVWELVTYQFLHQGIAHLLFNMLALFFLGPEVERGLGTNRFFIVYFLSGILGGLGWSLLTPAWHSCVGASGAVFGILGAFAVMYPQRELYIWGVLPVKSWLLVLILCAYELTNILNGPGGAIANAAHLGGGIAGTLYAATVARPDLIRKLLGKTKPSPQGPPVTRREIDRILDKAASNGMHSLTQHEKETLKKLKRGKN